MPLSLGCYGDTDNAALAAAQVVGLRSYNMAMFCMYTGTGHLVEDAEPPGDCYDPQTLGVSAAAERHRAVLASAPAHWERVLGEYDLTGADGLGCPAFVRRMLQADWRSNMHCSHADFKRRCAALRVPLPAPPPPAPEPGPPPRTAWAAAATPTQQQALQRRLARMRTAALAASPPRGTVRTRDDPDTPARPPPARRRSV
jgi:hypothetical protein